MSSKRFTRKLQEEVTCPICMEFLQEPVTIDCGHNFCLQCISRVGNASANVLPCPLCNFSVQRSTFRPNKLLANLVEEIQAMEPEREDLTCHRHGEKIHYFCEDDGEFLCLVCRDTKNHKSHHCTLINEAAEQYKGPIEKQVKVLKRKKKEILKEKVQGKGMITAFRAQVYLERLKIIEEFKVFRQRLEEEEHFILSRLDWLEREGTRQMQHYITDIDKQLDALKKLTDSLVAKLQMPPMQLLDDIKATLSRSEKFQFHNPTPIPGKLEKKINEAKSRHHCAITNLNKVRDDLQAEGEKDRRTFLEGMEDEDQKIWCLLETNMPELPTSDPVTLNADTAEGDLFVSQDLKTVRMGLGGACGGVSVRCTGPPRLYPFQSVLGSPSPRCGCWIWEAELQGSQGGTYVVGVASGVAPGCSFLQEELLHYLWAIRVSSSGCQPLTHSSALEYLSISPRRVGICMDLDHRELVFFDASSSRHIHTFHTSFKGPIFPLFGLLGPGSQIMLRP